MAYFGSRYFGPRYFGPRYFQTLPVLLPITDTNILQLPIDCILAGQQTYKESWREFEIPPARTRERIVAPHSRTRRLSAKPSTYTVKTGKRGYD